MLGHDCHTDTASRKQLLIHRTSLRPLRYEIVRLHIKITEILQEQNRKIKSCLVYVVLVNSNILTANYGVKQRQFTKPTSEPLR